MRPRRRTNATRGQALVESVLFLPVLLLFMFAVLFFDRIGLSSERTQSAVRYGDLVAFRHGQAYSAAVVGDVVSEALTHNTPDQLLDLCLAPGTAANPSSGDVTNSIAAALVQTQVAPGSSAPPAIPSPKPFWRPDQILSPSCSPGTVDLTSQPTGVGNMPLSVQTFNVAAGLNVPRYLAPALGGSAAATGVSDTSAHMAFVNVAAPSTLIGCVPGLNIVTRIINPAATGSVPCD